MLEHVAKFVAVACVWVVVVALVVVLKGGNWGSCAARMVLMIVVKEASVSAHGLCCDVLALL